MAWLIVFFKKETHELKALKGKDLLFIVLSGIATGASWLCYYYAIQNGQISIVVPIDKLSILITIAFSVICFKEKLKPKAIIGLILIVSATVCMAIFPKLVFIEFRRRFITARKSLFLITKPFLLLTVLHIFCIIPL